jgi:hypothetical protein
MTGLVNLLPSVETIAKNMQIRHLKMSIFSKPVKDSPIKPYIAVNGTFTLSSCYKMKYMKIN